MKKIVWLGFILGSLVGGLLPSLWGANQFSLSTAFFSFLGGAIGIWLSYTVGRRA